MAQSPVSLSSGDQANRTLYRSAHGDLSPSAMALAMVSGDSVLVASPALPRPRPAVAPGARPDRRRAAGGGRGRSRQGRFSPYPAPGIKLDLLRSVLQQRLLALGGGPARVPA